MVKVLIFLVKIVKKILKFRIVFLNIHYVASQIIHAPYAINALMSNPLVVKNFSTNNMKMR